MSSLTIAIPTYNRNEKLNNTLRLLLPQLNDKVKLLLIDNHSDVPISESVATLKFPAGVEANIIRNKANVGICANIMKCFEFCETEWMWLLSDDDAPLPSAIETILTDINKKNVSDFINYYSPDLCFPRPSSIFSKGISEFINKMDSFSGLLFISNGIYRMSKFASHLRWGYQYSNSFAPHVAMILKVADDGGEISLFNTEIVRFKEPEASQKWSWVNLTLGITSLLQLPLNINKKEFHILANHVYTHVLLDYDFFLAINDLYPRQLKHKHNLTYAMSLFVSNTFLRKRDIKSKVVNYLFCKSFENRIANKLLYALKGRYLAELEKGVRKGNPDRL